MASQLAGQSFLVTGATDGIGLHTAKRLAKAGATVLVHGRNPEKAQRAAEQVSSQNSSANVHAMSADLSSLQQVRQLAADVRHLLGDRSLDVLVNNAGVFAESKQITADGFELTWAVNVLAPFLLTSLLLDKVAERVVNVSSISASSRIDFDNLQQEQGFSSHNSYSLSKLALMMLTKEMAVRRPQRSKPTINCLDPGTVNTKMLEAGWGMCGIRIDQANDELYLATSPEVLDMHGEYFVSSKQRQMNGPALDTQQRQKLWDIVVQQTGADEAAFPT